MSVIASKILLASVGFIEPTASATYIEATATPSYIQPQVRLSYIQAVVTAEVTMPDVLAVEVVTPVDLVTLSTNKALSDTVDTPLDLLASVFGKAVSDNQTVNDSLVRDISKVLLDVQSVAEAKSVSFGKALADTTTPTDLASLLSVKALADTFDLPVDDLATVVHKGLADSQSISDVAVATLVFIRDFFDSINVPDSASTLFTPGLFEDTTLASDTDLLDISKYSDDSIFLIDNMDGDIEYAIIKVVGELLLSVDDTLVAFEANKDDNLSTGSNGVLTIQDYCDITYFLEDYVGTSRTFT